MEASALPAPAAVARTRPSIGAPLLRLRSDEQLVALFRAGHDEAFRVIHDRYRQRLFAYTRQMLAGSPGRRGRAPGHLRPRLLRACGPTDRELALRAWLYRVAHNRCIDELRRPAPPPPEVLELLRSPVHDPIAEADQRESLRRLIADVRRLPDQQRSALLMRELGGMSYADLAAALGRDHPGRQVAARAGQARPGPGARGARHRVLGDPRGADRRPRSRAAPERHRPAPHARLRRLSGVPPSSCAGSAAGSRRSSLRSARSACWPTCSASAGPGRSGSGRRRTRRERSGRNGLRGRRRRDVERRRHPRGDDPRRRSGNGRWRG